MAIQNKVKDILCTSTTHPNIHCQKFLSKLEVLHSERFVKLLGISDELTPNSQPVITKGNKPITRFGPTETRPLILLE